MRKSFHPLEQNQPDLPMILSEQKPKLTWRKIASARLITAFNSMILLYSCESDLLLELISLTCFSRSQKFA